MEIHDITLIFLHQASHSLLVKAFINQIQVLVYIVGCVSAEFYVLQFCFHAVQLICALEPYSDDALRLFSAEIEYSDENVEKLCAWLG